MPFSPFSSSARSLKFRGTWATAIIEHCNIPLLCGVEAIEKKSLEAVTRSV
jgi:hypothetical protein